MEDVNKVINKLVYLANDLELKAYESGDFGSEDRYRYQAAAVREAVEYLWQYKRLV